MVYRWDCRHCAFSAWSNSDERLEKNAGAHLFDHHSSKLSKADFRVAWDCPYCDAGETAHDKGAAAQAFKDHLDWHAGNSIESNAHLADEVENSGNVLVQTAADSAAADSARLQFTARSDLSIIVTKSPKERLRLLHDRFNGWPDRTVVMTTKRRPLAGAFDIDLSDAPVEVVELDRRLGPSQLGETISRVIDAHHTPDQRLAVGFDILYDIVSSFDLQTTHDFVSMLSSRLSEADALWHIYAEPRPQLSTALNVLEEYIDLTVETESGVFVVNG